MNFPKTITLKHYDLAREYVAATIEPGIRQSGDIKDAETAFQCFALLAAKFFNEDQLRFALVNEKSPLTNKETNFWIEQEPAILKESAAEFQRCAPYVISNHEANAFLYPKEKHISPSRVKEGVTKSYIRSVRGVEKVCRQLKEPVLEFVKQSVRSNRKAPDEKPVEKLDAVIVIDEVFEWVKGEVENILADKVDAHFTVEELTQIIDEKKQYNPFKARLGEVGKRYGAEFAFLYQRFSTSKTLPIQTNLKVTDVELPVLIESDDIPRPLLHSAAILIPALIKNAPPLPSSLPPLSNFQVSPGEFPRGKRFDSSVMLRRAGR